MARVHSHGEGRGRRQCRSAAAFLSAAYHYRFTFIHGDRVYIYVYVCVVCVRARECIYVALYTNRKSEAITRYGTDKAGPHVSRRLFKAYKISRASADTARLLSAIRAIFAIIRLVMGSHREGEGEMRRKKERESRATPVHRNYARS